MSDWRRLCRLEAPGARFLTALLTFRENDRPIDLNEQQTQNNCPG
ncbi:hypothetical protein [Nostoc sp.]